MRTSFTRTARVVLSLKLRFTSAATPAQRSRLAVVLGVALLSLTLTAPASAAAIVIRESVTMPIFETGLPDDCRPGVTGVLIGTDVVSYQSVETSHGYHIVMTVVDTGQIAWSDGTYTIIEATSHVSFVDTVARTTVLTVAHQDSGNTYSADGAFRSRATFQIVERLTASDGVVRVEFERGHFHFFGGC
jgi:hypothetical protein